jgi:LPXTG-motif cell wall-anchored protein
MATATQGRITKADIEAKLREIGGEVAQTAEAGRSALVAAGAGGVALVVTAAYFLGRRKGKRKSTVVEIRRV